MPKKTTAISACSSAGIHVEPHWEHFAHDADVGVRGYGASPAQAFEQAAVALSAIITDPTNIAARDKLVIECQAPDHELLLAEWLNNLIYEMATRKMLFAKFLVRLDADRLHAEVWGEPIDVARHRPTVEVKGATYTALRVAQEQGQWLAQTVVDV